MISRQRTFIRVLPTRWRRKPAGTDVERNYVTVTLYNIWLPVGEIALLTEIVKRTILNMSKLCWFTLLVCLLCLYYCFFLRLFVYRVRWWNKAVVAYITIAPSLSHRSYGEIREIRWCLGGWVAECMVSVLDSGTEGPGFKSRRCRVTVLGKLFTPIVLLFTKQQNW